MKRIKLGEVLDVRRGTSLSGEYYSESGEYIRITLGNFNYPNGGFKKNTAKKNIYFVGEVSPEFILKKGDIITPLTEQVRGLLGETATIPEDNRYIQSGDVGLIIPNEELLDKRFAYYLINSPIVKKQLDSGAQQTKIRHTSPDTIKDCIVWVPDTIQEQHKISSLLDSLDAQISLNRSIISDLESLSRQIYDYWFVQFDFPDEHGRPYKSSGGKMVWNEKIKRHIPEGWEVTSIGEITICHDSERIPVAARDRKIMEGNIPYYGATGIMGYVNSPIFNGDYVLLAEDGSIMDSKGHPIIQRITGASWVNNHAHVLEPREGYSCKLLMMLLKDIPVMQIKTGSIQMKINQENMNRYNLISIPPHLRKRINDILEPIDKKILSIKSENLSLTTLRDFLLPMLMNGQVTVK